MSKNPKPQKKIEPHIQHPYQPGSKIHKEYTSMKYNNGTKYISNLLDYEYKNQKGKLVQVIGYVLLSRTERTEYTQLNTSELNQMNINELTSYINNTLKWPERSESYDSFLAKYLTRRTELSSSHKPYYYDLKDV